MDAEHGAADATDYGYGNLKPPTEHTVVSLMLRESWEVLDCSEDDNGDQSAGEARIPVPVVVRDQQIPTRSQRKYRLASNYSTSGRRKGARKKRE